MTTLREAAQQALEALIEAARMLGATQAKKGFGLYTSEDGRLEQVLHESLAKHSNTLRTALAEPEQEPLTDEEIDDVCAPLGFAQLSPREVAHAIERAHGIGGEA